MAKKSATNPRSISKAKATSRPIPTSLLISSKGIKTANDYAAYMAAMLHDLTNGAITPEVGTVCYKVGSSLLRVVELQHKYGSTAPLEATDSKQLQLVS